MRNFCEENFIFLLRKVLKKKIVVKKLQRVKSNTEYNLERLILKKVQLEISSQMLMILNNFKLKRSVWNWNIISEKTFKSKGQFCNC